MGNDPQAVAVADVDGDRALDLVTANAVSRDVTILLGRGDGTFAGARRVTVGGSPQAVAVADLNGDRVLDLVAATGGVVILLGRGDGTFE